MSEGENVSRLLQQWLALTRSASEAIQVSDWTGLKNIQSRKFALRQPLDEAFQHWKPAENPFRAELGRLIALESHNAQTLRDRREKLRAKRASLERASKNLRNVRGAYAARKTGALNSYS